MGVFTFATCQCDLPQSSRAREITDKNNGLKQELQTVVFIDAEEETCPPARLRSDSRAGNRAESAAGVLTSGALAALLPLARRALGNTLLELLHVRIELRLMFGRQCGAQIVPLRLE